MADTEAIRAALRATILSEPEIVLDDTDVMRALVGANDRALGENVVDLRGLAMARLEVRLGRLADTHQSVLAAAYDNIAGTAAVHRAVLELLEATDFLEFAERLAGPVRTALRIDETRLVLGSGDGAPPAALPAGVVLAEPDFAGAYLALGGRPRRGVVLREIVPGQGSLFGPGDGGMRSEAAILLDLGPQRLPALLVLASSDPAQFHPGQATDLLAFFGGVVERVAARLLA
jgi:uncharacterized protein YigA (DUF484 family)